MPTNEMTIRTSHACIAVHDTGGNGLPIVMIHAPASSKDVFAAQFDSRLDREFRLIAIDLPGHGASSDAFCPENTYSVSGYADAVIEVLEFLGIDDAVVVAASLSGQVALEMMASFPGIVGVMLAGSSPLSCGDDGCIGGLCDNPAAVFDAGNERTHSQARTMFLDDLLAGNFTDGRVLAESTAVPLAVVNGARDTHIDNSFVAALDPSYVWEASARILPNVGAAPYAEVPEMFNQILRRFARAARRRRVEAGRGLGLSLSA